MTTQTKKYILATVELKNSAAGAFFQELGFDIQHAVAPGLDFSFAIDNICPEVTKLPRLSIKETIRPELKAFVKGAFSEDFLKDPISKNLLASYFEASVDFDLADRYSADYKNVYTAKIHEYLNIGYFVDSIIAPAYKSKFDINVMRDYLNTALNFAFKKTEQSSEALPIDVSYSHNSYAFVVQITFGVDDFKGEKELESIFESLTKYTSFFDVTYFQKRNKLTLSSLFFKEKNLAQLNSYFFTEIAKKSLVESEKIEEISALSENEKVTYVAQKNIDPQSQKLELARKLSLFIKNYRVMNEENPKEVASLEIQDIDQYLEHYPKPETLKTIDDEVKEFTLKLIKDDQLYSGISDYIQKVANSNLDGKVSDIQRVLGSKSLSDIEEVVMIKGSQADEDQITRVKAWVENGDNEKWEVKKGQLNERIQDEVTRVNSEGRNIVQDDIIRVVAKELKAEEQDVKIVVGGIVEEVVSSELVNKQKLEESFALKILSQQSADQVREKLESQVVRMKKIMDQLKKELVKLQNEKENREKNLVVGENSPDEAQILHLKSTLAKAMEVVKNKDKLIEKNKFDYEVTLNMKDQKIEKLNERIETLKGEFAQSREFANEEKLQQLEAENKSLHLRLELANKKVNIINENIENRTQEVSDKHTKEIDSLKQNMQMAQSVIERFKLDKLDMEAKLAASMEAARKLRDEREHAGSKESTAEKDSIISAMLAEKRALEDKYKLQGIELKKLEQKLKYTMSQLESSNKKKDGKSSDHHAKQLDQANARLAESTSEVAEKRKEIIKLKQENTMMSAKIAELEKKLGMDKKAS